MKIVINVGERKVQSRDLTVEEKAQRAIDDAKWELRKSQQANRDNISELRDLAIDAVLSSYLDDPNAPQAIQAYLRAKNG